ncbi:MAG: phosphatidate cytidylyltransferase [Pirellulaceae bacterium]|nr:phosphatidate cytidylyltransferase [Pirellulaceae bacterium]
MFADLNPILVNSLLCGFAFLICVTVFSAWMKMRRPDNKTFAKVWEIVGGWWIINLLLSAACLVGSRGLIVLFFCVSLLALHEFLKVQKLSLVGASEKLAMVVLAVAHYTFIFLEWKNFFLFIVPVMTYIYLPFFVLSRRKIDGLIQNLWAAQSGLMLCVYALSFAPGLLFLNVNPTSQRQIEPVVAFLFLFITTEMNDVFQFVSGKSFGRRKLVVEISPNKTVAGFVGGIVLTSLLSLLLAPIMLQINAWQSLLLGFCIALSGVSGDLMFSSLKRTAGVKDFSQLIPGHGGVLDRMDSIIFTAPTLYCLMYLFIHAPNQ